MVHYPLEFGSSKVPREVEKVFVAIFLSQLPGKLVAGFHGTTVAPYDRVPQCVSILVNAYQTMHLISDTNGANSRCGCSNFIYRLTNGIFSIGPPHFR